MVDRWLLRSSAVAGPHGTRPCPASPVTCGIGARVLLCVLNLNGIGDPCTTCVSIVAASGTESIEEFRTRY
jgi:hypothetical protein